MDYPSKDVHYASAEITDDWKQYLEQADLNEISVKKSDEPENEVREYQISKRGREVEVLSDRIFLPFSLTTSVLEEHKWNSEFQDLYERIFFSFPRQSSQPSSQEEEQEKRNVNVETPNDQVMKGKDRGDSGDPEPTEMSFEDREKDLLFCLEKMGNLYQDFIRYFVTFNPFFLWISFLGFEITPPFVTIWRVAKLYAELIVNELFINPTDRTLPPIGVGGVAGGDKVN